jgi:hypothetical protein
MMNADNTISYDTLQSSYIYMGDAEFERTGNGIYTNIEDLPRGEYAISTLDINKHKFTTKLYIYNPKPFGEAERQEVMYSTNEDDVIQAFFRRYNVRTSHYRLYNIKTDELVSSFYFEVI